jgi:ferredoxin
MNAWVGKTFCFCSVALQATDKYLQMFQLNGSLRSDMDNGLLQVPYQMRDFACGGCRWSVENAYSSLAPYSTSEDQGKNRSLASPCVL